MNIEISNGALRLSRGQALKVRDGAGSTICAREGSLWITEEGSNVDVILEQGGCFKLQKPGLAIVQAFADAAVSLN